ncbi:MAG: bifunctional oligoribonuclease/PAP phosphatase NrnA [Lachnospiraceae bacterium]|nr:bifunctional oligoribonuclease/PAP phosphatase NrnA [Lachnospiraceae bacterium]
MNIDEILKNVKTVGISGHVRPDGDCIGSTLGLYLYIKKYFKDVTVELNLEKNPSCFDFLTGVDEINHSQSDKVYDVYFALDCGDLTRLGDFAKLFQSAKHTVCIDHHKSNTDFADESLIKPGYSSTSQMVFELLPEEKIDKDIAECLYVGIIHDTGVFQYSSTTKDTMRAAGILMDKGIDYAGIIDRTFFEKSYVQNRIMAKAILDSTLYEDGKIISSVISKATMNEYNACPFDLDGIINQLRITSGVEVAIFLYESGENEYKVSLRSKKRVDLSKIALKFGGGGHERAAGATITGEPNEIIERVITEIRKEL